MPEPSKTGDDRRRHRRVPVRVVIDYETADAFFTDYALNLSLGGIFICTDDLLPVGTRLRIHFSIPEHERFIDGWGKVARVQEARGPDHPAGVGIALEKLDDTARSIIDDLVGGSTL